MLFSLKIWKSYVSQIQGKHKSVGIPAAGWNNNAHPIMFAKVNWSQRLCVYLVCVTSAHPWDGAAVRQPGDRDGLW